MLVRRSLWLRLTEKQAANSSSSVWDVNSWEDMVVPRYSSSCRLFYCCCVFWSIEMVIDCRMYEWSNIDCIVRTERIAHHES